MTGVQTCALPIYYLLANKKVKMEHIITYFLPVLVTIALICVTISALNNIGQFGDANQLKKDSFFRILFNFVSILILLLILYAKEKDIINETYFYTLFTAVVVSLGIKMTADFINKN